jgi:cell division protein YceG involved in septum cleavage
MESCGWGIIRKYMRQKATSGVRIQKKTRFMSWLKPVLYVGVALVVVAVGTLSFFVIQGKSTLSEQTSEIQLFPTTEESDVALSVVFPVGVNPEEKEITESPALEEFVGEYIAPTDQTLSIRTDWLSRAMGKLALMNWYQNLASLSSRVLVVESGERKEQIAEHFGKILGWDAATKKEFLALIQGTAPALEDGKFFPGTYTVARGATPAEVAPLILDRFNTEVLARYSPEVEALVPLNDALTIASLLEREARDFDDMRHISGVIWNRLFVDMKLQIDATLQYAKGSKPSEPWWPRVIPSDKYLTSDYNTYKNEGLPPTPIANPSLESIIAALNPTKTDCMYYFHDKKGGFHCTATYEEHVALLKQFYGRGK